MAGYKITTIFAILFIVGACVNSSMAKDAGRKEKGAETSIAKDAKKDHKIEDCVMNKCKPAKGQETPDTQCTISCLKEALGVKDKADMKQLEKELTSVAQDLFCFVGCATSGICPEDNKTDQGEFSRH
ncbi:Bone morphogenetic protein receptor type-1A [Bienertia sinuspersici]